MITQSDHRILVEIGRLGESGPMSSARIARLLPESPGKDTAASRLARAGYLEAREVPWGKQGKTRVVYLRTASPIPRECPPWVLLLPPKELGDPIRLASPRGGLSASPDPDVALRFPDERSAATFLANVRGQFPGYNPRVANLDRLSLAEGVAR